MVIERNVVIGGNKIINCGVRVLQLDITIAAKINEQELDTHAPQKENRSHRQAKKETRDHSTSTG